MRAKLDAASVVALASVARGVLGQSGLSYAVLRDGVRERLSRDPLDSIVAIALGGSYLFWLAEKDHNPKCTTIWDALAFITTSFSVGYDDVFAKTAAGKAIASFVMTVGPALAAKALDVPPAQDTAAQESLVLQKATLARLDEIALLLRGER